MPSLPPAARGGLVTAGAAALVAGTGFAHGGYFPGPWGWATLGAAWSGAAVLLAREDAALSRAGAAAAALLVGLTAWTVVGAAWSLDVTQTALEAERTAVYAAALLGALLCARRRPDRLVRGAWAAIAALCVWALATRLVPDRWGVVDAVSGYRLSEPIGYWNSLGLLAGMGTLLALGLAARAGTTAGRAVAGATVPALLTTLYFTFSRGGWIAFGFGLALLLAVDRRRLQLAAVAAALGPLAGVALWRASSSRALTTPGFPLREMAREGHRLVGVFWTLAVLAAVAVALLRRVEGRLALPERWAGPARLATAAAAVLAVVAVVAAFGAPWTIARRSWDAFAAAPPPTAGNLNARLFNLSGNGRLPQWRVAAQQVAAYPALGSGAGTFETWWNRHRTLPGRVRDVHDLYLETLAELGPLGLALLAGALALPLLAGVRQRGEPLAAAALAAYGAYLLHTVVDWDWELASVTLAALLCAAALLAGGAAPLGRRLRRAALVTALALAGCGVYTVATRVPIDRLASAAAHGRWAAAERDARAAAAVAPWSEEPWLRLGEAELAAGRTAQARTAFHRAAAAEPDDWTAWWDLARASRGRARLRALARAAAANPLSPEVAALRARR